MENVVQQVVTKMVEYFGNDVRRINHALKVYGLARSIAILEGIEGRRLFGLEVAGILHDIGIKESERKYNSSAGRYQEIEGPPIVRKMLSEYDLPEGTVERVCFLVGHHHTYGKIDDIDFQILVEADFLVNIFEEGMSVRQAKSIEDKYFRTNAGVRYLRSMFC